MGLLIAPPIHALLSGKDDTTRFTLRRQASAATPPERSPYAFTDRGEVRTITQAAPKGGDEEPDIVWGLLEPFEVRHDDDQ